MKKRVYQTVVIAAFFAVIAAPLLAFQKPGRTSVVMNKTTAKWSSVADHSPMDAGFTAAVDEVISDNIGFKDEANVLNIAAMYRLFDRIAIADYVKGEDNHCFYLPEGVMNSFQGLDGISEAKMQGLAQQLVELGEEAETYGSQFVFMPIPNKDTVYRECVPDSIHVLSEDNFLHGLKEYLLANTNVHVVDVENALLAHKSGEEALYWRNVDTAHWNDLGAFIGYQSLMETITEIGPSVPYPHEEEVDISVEEVHNAFGFLSYYYDLIKETFSALPDESYTVSLPERWQYGQEDNSTPSAFSLANDMRDLYFHYHNDAAGSDRSILIYGDSYIYSYLLPQISVCFEDVYFLNANSNNPEIIAELLSFLPEPTDFIVYETVARQTSYERISSLVYELSGILRGLSNADKIQTLISQRYSTRDHAIHVDTIGDQTVVNVPALAKDDEVVLSGWAADFDDKTETGGVVAKIRNKMVTAARVRRPDLGEELADAGYRLVIPASYLEGESKMQIYAITPDGTAVYPPVELKIVY